MKRFLHILSTSFAAISVLLVSSLAWAEEAGAAAEINPIAMENGWAIAIAVAVGIGLAAFGGAFGQGRAVSAALEGISRNPNAADKVFVPMILGLAFIESLVLFTWVLMFLMMSANLT